MDRDGTAEYEQLVVGVMTAENGVLLFVMYWKIQLGRSLSLQVLVLQTLGSEFDPPGHVGKPSMVVHAYNPALRRQRQICGAPWPAGMPIRKCQSQVMLVVMKEEICPPALAVCLSLLQSVGDGIGLVVITSGLCRCV